MDVVQIGDATLYRGDCREILPTLGRVDAVVTDPPYGIGDAPIQGQGRTRKRTGAVNTWHPASLWDREFPADLARLCAEASDLVAWFGHWRKRIAAETAIGLPLRAEIVWAKNCHVGPPCPLASRDERIWLFSRSGIKRQTFETTVWDHPIIPTWAYRHHKNEKPVGLIERLLRFLGPDTVLDPFMGSGTTGVACAQLGRRFIGVECEPRYFEIACRRIEAAQTAANDNNPAATVAA